MKIENWERLQHYNKPNPPWLKLYRELLDDPYYHSMPPIAAKYFFLLWLVCCETAGTLPPPQVLAFRLRVDIERLQGFIKSWSRYLKGDSREYLESVYSESIPETETETETETENTLAVSGVGDGAQKVNPLPSGEGERAPRYPADFSAFWDAYPRRENKAEAYKAWKRARIGEGMLERILSALAVQKQARKWQEEGGKFVPYAQKWINGRRWEDETAAPMAGKHDEYAGIRRVGYGDDEERPQ